MHFIIDNRPDDWTQLEQMYDKSGKYRMDYIKSKSDSNENNQDNENSSKNNN
uniref:Chemosensory protein 1 n=1 Tax=Propsilocerus akamusi TaxID=903466 RepID=A0A7D0PC82_9DIPT|nr:chemosensory protein 1 [Propsilocerus akamusi]